MSRKDLPLRAIFGTPAAIAVLSLVGLTAALMDDGPWDAVSAALLAASLAAAVWALAARRR